MKAILALTSLLAASAVNLAATHESHAETLVIFTHGANGTETNVVRRPALTADQCATAAAYVWDVAHKTDNATLDAYCESDSRAFEATR